MDLVDCIFRVTCTQVIVVVPVGAPSSTIELPHDDEGKSAQ